MLVYRLLMSMPLFWYAYCLRSRIAGNRKSIEAGSRAELVNKVNIYTSQTCPGASVAPDGLRLRQAAAFVTRVLAVLGLSDGLGDSLGFSAGNSPSGGGDAAAAAPAGAAAVQDVFRAFVGDATTAAGEHSETFAECGLKVDALDKIDEADSALDEFARVRDAVRVRAQQAGDAKAAASGVLAACDRARDEGLVAIGVKLEDKPQGAVWMRVDLLSCNKRCAVHLLHHMHTCACVYLAASVPMKQRCCLSASQCSHRMRLPAPIQSLRLAHALAPIATSHEFERRVQMREKQRAADASAADKAEKKLVLAREELTKAERVLQHGSAQAALADRFRFDGDGAAAQELKEGEWVVRVRPSSR